MGNILGEPFKKYIQTQIIQRQKIHGGNRTAEAIQYLNSKNAWIKLASGVSIDEKRMKMLEGNPLAQGIPLGNSLAKNNVLFNGLIDPFEDVNGVQRDVYGTSDRAGFGKDTVGLGSGTSINNQAYGVGGFGGVDGDFGFSPMPGIVDASLTTLNRGSIKKASVTIKCYNKYQFDIIDILYLRLGYSIFLEFGFSNYFDQDNNYSTENQSLINEGFFFNSSFDKSDYSKWLPLIEQRRKESGGNYEGVFGVISNFSWTFENDGSYNIKLEIITHGDVIESLKVNLPPINKDGMSAIEQQIKQKKIRQIIRDFNENTVLGVGAFKSQDEFYTLYDGLKELIEEWYNNALNRYNGLSYKFSNGFGVTGYLDDVLIDAQNVPNYIFGAGDTGFEGVSAEQLTNEMNKVLKSSLELAIKYSFEPASANLREEDVRVFIQSGYAVLKNVFGFGEDVIAFRDKLRFLDGFQKRQNAFNATLDPGLAMPVIGLEPGIPLFRTKFERNQSSQANAMPGSNNYGDSALEVFERLYDGIENSNALDKGFQKQKLLLEYVGIERILSVFYHWCYTQYLQVTLYDAEDDLALADTDAKSEGDDSGEKSQMQLDLEQKGKNRIREYLYNVRYFDTVGDTELRRQGNARTKYERLKQNEFNKAIEKKEESQNLLNLSQVSDSSLDRLVPITIVNPNVTQTVPLNTTDDSTISDEDVLQGREDILRSSPSLTPGQITENIKEWNSRLFPVLDPENGNEVEIVALDINEPKYSYFIRLGTFLDFLQQRVIPKIDNSDEIGQPLITIDTDPEKNICYVNDSTISFDPRKCILKNDNYPFSEDLDSSNKPTIYKELNTFFGSCGNYRYGKIMNIYFNFNRIQEIFDDVDEKNKISLFEVIKTLCEDINECLGGLNNIEPVITDETPVFDESDPRALYANVNSYSGNTITLIDQTHIPGIEQIALKLKLPNFQEEIYTLDVYGYSKKPDPDMGVVNHSPFVRNLNLTTQIDKNYATMITIGATANGEIPGDNATAFSKWNVGVTDRFKNNVIDAVATTASLAEQNAQTIKDYTAMTSVENYLGLLGFNDDLTINEDYIATQKSVYNSFVSYMQAEKTKRDIEKNLTGLGDSSIGFIPFNLKLTMDGISGMKIYNKIKVDTRFLPSNYPETLKFIVTGIDHQVSNNNWETVISTIATSQGVFNESTDSSSNYNDGDTQEDDTQNNTQEDDVIDTQSIINKNKKKTTQKKVTDKEKEIKKEKLQKEKESKTETKVVSDVKEEDSQTLGTSSGPITNPNAYKTPTELEAAIKKGLEVIDSTPSTVKNKYAELRKRIIRIAASYVGQLEIQPNKGFLDPTYEEMYKSIKWKPGLEWCNYTMWLWWYQAFTVGNDYVSSTSNYPSIFDSPQRHSMHPENIKNVDSDFRYAVAPSSFDSQPPGSGLHRGFMDPGTVNSKNHFQKIKKWVPINCDPSKLKPAIQNHKILPGDAIYFDWKKRKPGFSDTSHIGMYLCPGDINCNTIWTIEGNATNDAKPSVQGVWKKNRKGVVLSQIRGFGQLFTSNDFS